MDAQKLEQFCLSFPGAYADFPFGEEYAVFKVRASAGAGPAEVPGKMFAMLINGNTRLNLKCDPPVSEALRAEYPAITPGYHMSKKHWITVEFGELEDEFVRELVEDSYDLVVSKMTRAQQERLRWRGLAAN